ncbi:MAG: hypothetical protein AVDCRST_MAG18-1662 [uncultured Thermomicrobiales bacterium]|uniref:Uncharacterized protein n=1 Tax=uncultured Thermomicrobiales bacterium TaxID=1645740 RepID=A0A6J4V2Z2_9BACT|nr:MAG: hypothetical protein AVDCRST_MAG18-1662 [uncultured Thermomicrobiales bacterium]
MTGRDEHAVPTISASDAARRYDGEVCGADDLPPALIVCWGWLGAMCELANKRYSHDGMSFRGFIAGPSLPYCAHFPGPQSGADGQEGDRAR